jgi:plasmid stability protein
MATLYVENVPDDLYDALRKRAKRNRKSIATEVIELLHQFVPTEAELKRRHEFYKDIQRFRKLKPLSPGPFPSTEEMLREDRER